MSRCASAPATKSGIVSSGGGCDFFATRSAIDSRNPSLPSTSRTGIRRREKRREKTKLAEVVLSVFLERFFGLIRLKKEFSMVVFGLCGFGQILLIKGRHKK